MRQNNNDFNKRGLAVEVRNGDISFAMRKLKKKVQDDGILQELRQKEAFQKPSEAKRIAKKAGRARWLKKLRTMDDVDMPSSTKPKR